MICWAESIFRSGTLTSGFGEESMKAKLGSEHVILSFPQSLSHFILALNGIVRSFTPPKPVCSCIFHQDLDSY